MLEAEKEKLIRLQHKIENRMKSAPKGTLRISHSNHRLQYYHRMDPKDTKGKYIRKSEKELAKQLAQKEYDKKIYAEIGIQIQEITRVLERYSPGQLEQIYDHLLPCRRELVEPVVQPIHEYVTQWKNVKYESMGFSEDGIELYTDAGERVRSKSEIIIANKLLMRGIPYRYEYPIMFASGRVVHPDFYCLNTRTRCEFVWEHFGMMNNEDYVNKAIRKISEYQRNGFWWGKNMIASFETTEKPVNVYEIDEMIRNYLI